MRFFSLPALTAPGLLAALALLSSCTLMPPQLPAFDRRAIPFDDPGSALPEGWQHGPFMEIHVRAWRDSNGDGIGDLRGLIASLDYLKALGIKGLWLMPITRSADHDHGYAVTDLRNIEPAYGTLADFDELLDQAHQRGIGVIMDYVMNHSAATHPAFLQSQALRGQPMRDWFIWRDTAPAGWSIWNQNPWYPAGGSHFFATFGPHMPDFDLRQPAVLAYHRDSLRFWLNRGLDGFRFDAVTHLIENDAQHWDDQPESYAVMRDVQQVMAAYKQRYLVCEATHSPQVWASAQGCGSAFAFDLSALLIDAARGKAEAITRLSAYFKTAPPTMATMLSNHDVFAGRRPWDQLQGDMAAYRLAAASYLLLPGIPFIYYGEEIGMAGVARLPGDAQLRVPMSWTADGRGFSSGTPFRPLADNAATHNVAAAQQDPASILAFYKTLLALRNSLPPLARGSYAAPQVDGQVMAFRRQLGEEQVLVLINYGREAATLPVSGLPANALLSNEFPAGGAVSRVDGSGALRFALAGQSLRVLRLLPARPAGE